MKFHLLDPLGNDSHKLSEIFENIYNKNTVAFLGAGASISNNRYLSSDIIQLYQTKISKDFGTADIVKFVDILQQTPGLRRGDLDKFVVDQLVKLEPNDGHKIFVTIPWKQVITTNYDTLVEEASDIAIRNNLTHYKLHVVKKKSQLAFQSSADEIVYIKLNGCKSDLSEYPLVFSSEDFTKANSYYKAVLNSYKMYANDIGYLSFGYSFSDPFAELLLDKISSADARQKRILYCVDPFINEDRLSYLESKKIAVIKMTFVEFMTEYQNWLEQTSKNEIRNLQKFTNPDNSTIKVQNLTRLILENSIIQLKDDYRPNNKIRKSDFYNGEEPNYQVIIEDFDVKRTLALKSINEFIIDTFNEQTKTNIPKLILIKGEFGSGKSTFTLRAIKEYLAKDKNTLAFEVSNPIKVKRGYLSAIIKESSANQFIFYCDNIETDSIYKSFNELRVDLASEQISGIKIIFISSIRENILEKYKARKQQHIANCLEFPYKAEYSKIETIQLVENLKEVGVLEYRDLTERDIIVSDVVSKYKGDSFVTLYDLIQEGYHYKFLEKAFKELSIEVKKAFKVTALTHRFNILCPAYLVKNALDEFDWDEFTDKVLKEDGKGILFQEFSTGDFNEPNLFFRTKHPVIADALTKRLINNAEKNSLYKTIFNSISPSDFNAKFAVDLIKAIRNNDADITEGQIEKYYEIAKKNLSSYPHFMLSYITNIEVRSQSIDELKECINEIKLLESEIEKRNHRLIHRKGSLCFKIARLYLREKAEESIILSYALEAEEWFEVKKQLDPSSSYSYLDYFKLLFWKLKELDLSDTEKSLTHLQINTLFDEAFRLLYTDLEKINEKKNEYNSRYGSKSNNNEYLYFILDLYQDVNRRHIACILLFYYYEEIGERAKSEDFKRELERYTDDRDVVYFLFKQYGRNLHNINNRLKFFDLIRKNSYLREEYPLRYFYFSAICEFYNYRWKDGRELLMELSKEHVFRVNPDFYQYWISAEGLPEEFDAIIINNSKFRKARITSPFYKDFFLVKGNYADLKIDDEVKVRLRFFLDEVKAEIVVS